MLRQFHDFHEGYNKVGIIVICKGRIPTKETISVSIAISRKITPFLIFNLASSDDSM